MLCALVAHAEVESEWIRHTHTALQFEVKAPATWERFDPKKNANSPMGDLELNSSKNPRVTFDLSVERQGRRFPEMVRLMDDTTRAYQTNGMIVQLHRSVGTNDFGNNWVTYDTLTVESGQTNRISMILVDGGKKPTLIGTAFIREDLDENGNAIITRMFRSIDHIRPSARAYPPPAAAQP